MSASESRGATEPDAQPDFTALSILLQLEAMARAAESPKALQFIAVNETRRLVAYRQAYLFQASGISDYRLEAASSIAVIERDAPFVRWLERVIATAWPGSRVKSNQLLDLQSCPGITTR